MRNSQKGFASVLILILVAVVIVGGIYYFSINKAGTNQSSETANWKIYKNDKYGIEFKYPSDWQLNEPSGGYPHLLSLTSPQQKELAEKYPNAQPSSNLRINIFESVKNLPVNNKSETFSTLKEWIMKDSAYRSNYQGEEKVGGLAAYKTGYLGESEGTVYFVQYGQRVAIIDFNTNPAARSPEEWLSAEDKVILSTFTFTDIAQ